MSRRRYSRRYSQADEPATPPGTMGTHRCHPATQPGAMVSVRQRSLPDLPPSIMTFLRVSDVLESFMCVDRGCFGASFRGWGCFGSSVQPEEILVLVRHCVRAYYNRTIFVSQFAFEWEGEICWLAEWTQVLRRRWPDWINSSDKNRGPAHALGEIAF